MDIRFLGAHNCESRETRLVSLLVDDRLALDAGGLTSRLSFSAQLKLKAVLLTHEHFDHIRDIPTLAMNFLLRRASINIYSIPPVFDALKTYFLDGKLYPNFLERPRQNPTLKFMTIEPLEPMMIDDYTILAVPVSHSQPAVGYQVTSADGKSLFYTGDTGPGLAACWRHISPQLLITEVTAPNKYDEFARESGHLTPNLLKQELLAFRELKGYLPRVTTVHMNPDLETEIARELAVVAEELRTSIVLANEGLEIRL